MSCACSAVGLARSPRAAVRVDRRATRKARNRPDRAWCGCGPVATSGASGGRALVGVAANLEHGSAFGGWHRCSPVTTARHFLQVLGRGIGHDVWPATYDVGGSHAQVPARSQLHPGRSPTRRRDGGGVLLRARRHRRVRHRRPAGQPSAAALARAVTSGGAATAHTVVLLTRPRSKQPRPGGSGTVRPAPEGSSGPKVHPYGPAPLPQGFPTLTV